MHANIDFSLIKGEYFNVNDISFHDKNYKFIHDSEIDIRTRACRNTAIGSTTAAVEFNNWGVDLNGTPGSITVYTPEASGGVSLTTEVPLVNLSLPTSIGPQAGCP